MLPMLPIPCFHRRQRATCFQLNLASPLRLGRRQQRKNSPQGLGVFLVVLAVRVLDGLGDTYPPVMTMEDIYTSSTAQGGGGSFKDRKPIGEVDCCDAWMAEQSH